MYAILVHGMGRTPLSLCLLAFRLKRAGIKTYFFAYSVTFEHWNECLARLKKTIEQSPACDDFIIIGHSLGTVLTRAVLPDLARKPLACFFLAPPTQACVLARKFAPYLWYRLLTGQMGQKLADPQFMDSLPIPDIFTKIYSGSARIGKWLMLGTTPNDGILKVSETLLPPVAQQTVSASHTFIMNNRVVAQDIIKSVQKYSPDCGIETP
jgi:hypothetical protein